MFGLFSCDIGIDLGTANTLVHVARQGLVINEPTVIAIDAKKNKVAAIGLEAKKMLGRTPPELLRAVRPMRDGVIAEFDLVETLLTTFIKRVQKYPLFIVHPRVVVGVPSGITEVEKRAVIEAATHAGAKEVHLVHEPMAAAIGMGIPVEEPCGNMVVDIGGGTSDIAVIALNGIACQSSVRTAGDEMDEAIIRYMRSMYNLGIGPNTAEQIKMEIGSAHPLEEELSMDVKGHDYIAGMPRMVNITSNEIREALNEPITTIIDAVKDTLGKTDPQLSADIYDKGIIMTGGGSLLRNFDARIREETGLPVNVIDDALICVCKGTARILDDLEKYRSVLIASSN